MRAGLGLCAVASVPDATVDTSPPGVAWASMEKCGDTQGGEEKDALLLQWAAKLFGIVV